MLVGGIGDDPLVAGLEVDLYRFDSKSGRDLILGSTHCGATGSRKAARPIRSACQETAMG